jgi:hypothetical protein
LQIGQTKRSAGPFCLANVPNYRTNAAINTQATDIQMAANLPANIVVSVAPILRRRLG